MFDEGSEGHNLQVRLNCEQDFISVVRLHPEVEVSNETAAAKSPQCIRSTVKAFAASLLSTE